MDFPYTSVKHFIFRLSLSLSCMSSFATSKYLNIGLSCFVFPVNCTSSTFLPHSPYPNVSHGHTISALTVWPSTKRVYFWCPSNVLMCFWKMLWLKQPYCLWPYSQLKLFIVIFNLLWSEFDETNATFRSASTYLDHRIPFIQLAPKLVKNYYQFDPWSHEQYIP